MRSTITHLLSVFFILFLFVQCDNSSISGPAPADEVDELDQPELISPTDEAVNQSVQVELNWKRIKGAKEYRIQIATTNNFDSAMVDSMIEGSSFTTSQFQKGTTYYWQVKPFKKNFSGPWSETWEFTTAEGEPEKVTVDLKSPDDGAQLETTSPTLDWTTASESAEYHYQVSETADFSVLAKDSVVTSSAVEVESLEGSKQYYWRVNPILDSATGEWSKVHDFTTNETTQPKPVTLLSPSDGASDQATTLKLDWEEIAGITDYQVQLASNNAFDSPVVNKSTSESFLEVSGLQNDQTYYWRVQANGDEDSGNWSTTFSFSTESGTSTDPGPSGSVEGDRQALMDLYNATGGTSWDNRTGWGSGNPSDSWYGVEVNSSGRVVRLDLSGNNLSGSLPESIGNLTSLKYLNLKQNDLVSQIPSSIGNMISLTHLLLNGRVEDMTANGNYHPGKPAGRTGAWERSNQFYGQIPKSIGNLQNLQYLEISGQGSVDIKDGSGHPNSLSGPIPSEIGNLTNLIGLHLGYNSLDSVPSSLGNLKKLVHLGLLRNKLAGQGFPQEIGSLTNLENVWLGYNNFGGSIPNISGLSDLRIFIVPFNNLEGQIPAYLFNGSMAEINLVNLAWNNLTGTLPEFRWPNNLKALQVDGNKLTGNIPSSIDSIPLMVNFSLGWNNFEGQIPDLSHMQNLRYLRANNNNFTGAPPMVDVNNDKLQFLHFQNNGMSQQIPSKLAEVGNLPKFRTLNISSNNFTTSDIQPLINELQSDGNLDILVK